MGTVWFSLQAAQCECTWDVGELNLLGHGPHLLLQLLVAETHHLPFERGGQQLLLSSLTKAIDVTLGREATETILHEGITILKHPDALKWNH